MAPPRVVTAGALSLALAVTGAVAAPVTVSNVAPRRDTSGALVNAHDGCLVQFSPGGLFYQYGTVYGNCSQGGPVCNGKCGYFGSTFALYTSPDLVQWTLVSPSVLPEMERDNDRVSYWEANVAYNAATGAYVMVYWSGHYGFVNGSVAVATSASPAGPFVNAPPIVVRGSRRISDTVALFVDPADGVAYVRYNTYDLPRQHIVERLDASWLSSTGEYGVIFAKPDFPWYDGGGMLARNGVYYVMLSFDCCFCQWGSDALVFVAASPLGPWRPQARTPVGAAGLSPVPPRAREGARAATGPAGACNLTGLWAGVLGGQQPGPPNLRLVHDVVSNTVTAVTLEGRDETVVGNYDPANASVVFPSFPGVDGALVGAVTAYDGGSSACSEVAWLPPFSPPGSFWCLWPTCGPPPVPPANWTNEANLCADGSQPPAHVADMKINPCDQSAVGGVNFTVPAQQFGVSALTNASGATTFLFYGEHFNSASDGLKSHDLQAWIPLEFDDAGGGLMAALRWADEFTVWL